MKFVSTSFLESGGIVEVDWGITQENDTVNEKRLGR